ncbi:MAG: 16S rRNA (adenine(1518)-N(6)/adenine(1519)-N(6))-dimethyltransferase RsmA, partial [Candidatus Omnitrophota bacterium]|nr:16S rRNA (adenine(1518)-N(6)/adenine(1519)-N(6))-dimethyltransferase RsmA [Candidatus Omnitrophota bacterium]
MHIKFLPKKSLGQNFIFDENILKKIVSHLGLEKKDTVLEIGAGLGTLTNFLIKSAGEVIALEIDKRAVEVLHDKFKDEKNIEIVNQDILKYVIPRKFIRKKLIVVGNIPFYITSPIIERLFGFRDRIDSIFLTVQKEVAKRIAAKPSTKDYGALTCFVRYHSRPEILFDIKAGSFSPAPKVDAAFI